MKPTPYPNSAMNRKTSIANAILLTLGATLPTPYAGAQTVIAPALETSTEGGPWRKLPTAALRALPDGRLWLPFADQIVDYRIQIGNPERSATGEPIVQRLTPLSALPQEGAFLTLNQSANLKDWNPLNANLLSVDQAGFLLPMENGRGFWTITTEQTIPDPTPVPPLQIVPNPDANFGRSPWTPATGNGTGSSGIAPYDIPSDPVSFPGSHAFNKYLFEERVHQIFEGDVKGYGLVIADKDGFQSTVSGGWARDPADLNGGGGRGMSTFRPSNIGSCAKLYTGVALMQLLAAKGPNLSTALDEKIADYLPPLWLDPSRRPANVTFIQANSVVAKANSISFRMLLDHTSGFDEITVSGPGGAPENLQDNPDYYNFTQALLTQGCYSYSNENYRIMTYLIASLVDGPGLLAVHTSSYQLPMDEYLDIMSHAYGSAFESYMTNVFFPQVAGAFAPSADPANAYPAGSTALMYEDPSDTQGIQWSQKELTGFARGQGGYWSSARELTRFLMSLMYTPDLLSAQGQQLLFGQVPGDCDPPAVLSLINNGWAQHTGFTDELGTALWWSKPGEQKSGIEPKGTSIANAMFMPYGWVCSYVGNSDTASGKSSNALFRSVLGAFYDATRDKPETISREAMTVSDFSQTADYLRDHRMAVKWLDLYDVAGVPYVNAVFGDVSEPVAGKIGMNAQSFEAFLNYWVKDQGFAIQQVESYLHAGLIRYAAMITEEDRPEQRSYHGLNSIEHNAKADAWTNEGFAPINVSVVSLNGVLRYTALYEKRPIANRLHTVLSAAEYDQKSSEYFAQGFKAVSVNAYRHSGQIYYAAIWHKLGGPQAGLFGVDRHAYRAADANRLNGGLQPTIVTGVDFGSEVPSAASRHRFGSIWR